MMLTQQAASWSPRKRSQGLICASCESRSRECVDALSTIDMLKRLIAHTAPSNAVTHKFGNSHAVYPA